MIDANFIEKMILHQQLDHITTSIEKGDYSISGTIEEIDELIAEVRERIFKYQAQSTLNGLNLNLKTFTSYAKRNKAKVIATLEDVRCDMASKKPNNKAMLSQLNQIKKTNFFTDKLQEKMLIDRITHHKSVIQDVILGVK